MSRIVAAAVAALVAALAALTATSAPVAGTATPAPLPACASEEGSGGPVPCLWDATATGNGQGQSFVLLSEGVTV